MPRKSSRIGLTRARDELVQKKVMSKATYDKDQGPDRRQVGTAVRTGRLDHVGRFTVESGTCAPASRTGPRKGSVSGIAIGSGGYSPYWRAFRVSLIGSRSRGKTPP